MGCESCPRRCGADRSKSPGPCGVWGESTPRVARAALHFWEEPMLSGSRGSGTVFFSGCNLHCLFCQNHAISAKQMGEPCPPERLCALFLALQRQGAHNINLVTPTPHAVAIREAIQMARGLGLTIPVAYNTNGYERVETLRSLEGLVDIWLPDLKYVTPALAERLSGAADYFDFAGPAILEMQRQVGLLELDGEGIAKRGLILRHLVLPGCVDETRRVLDFIAANLPKETHISLMRQYTPAGEIEKLPPVLRRPLTDREYARAIAHCEALGLTNVLAQEAESADGKFTPDFSNDLGDIGKNGVCS